MAQVKDNLLELEVVYSKLNKALDENISRLNTGATAVENYNKKISVVPSEFQKSLTDIKTKTDAVTVSARKLEQQSIKESNARNALNKQREVTLKQLDREQQKLNASQNLYNKIQQKLNSLSNEYKQLATAKSIGIKQTEDEAKRMEFLLGKITKYDTALKAVDVTMGKHSRNVGNYTNSGFNPLSNSINQLTREMPAFTYSVQTGFMALSNNIPIFTDAIGNAVRQNKELISQGEPTKSVLKQVAGAFFSWQTLMGVGITLLTVYGKEIGEFIKNALAGSNALNVLTESTKQINEARLEGVKTAQDELTTLRVLLGVAKDETKSKQQRLLAVNELQEKYPDYLGNLSKEEILAGKTADAEQRLTSAILSRAKAQAATTKITENQGKIIDLEERKLQLAKELEEQNTRNVSLERSMIAETKRVTENNYALDRYNEGTANSLSLKNKIANIDKEISDQNDINNRLTSYAIDNQILFDKEKTKSLNTTKESTKAQKEQNEILKIGTEKWIKEQISVLQELRSTNDTTTESYNLSTKSIEFYNQWLERLKGTTKDVKEETEGVSISLKDLADDTAQVEGSFDKLGALTFFDEFKKSFIDTFASNSGFGKLFNLLSTDLEKFKGDAQATALAVSDAFQEAFNTIASANQQNFDFERELNEERYQNALTFANGNAEAEAELLKEKERREKEIARREAKAKKEMALFNIAIDGAQAIVAAAPNFALMALVGVLTATQLALVASQEIPEFWKGTDNAPEGWAKTNERGAEIHTDSKGNIKDLGTNKGTQVKYLQKGDKIINANKTKELLSLSSFNKEYNDMLFRNQILPPIMINNSNNVDLSGVESKLDKLVNKSELTIVDDENGRRYYEKKNNATIELKNSRIYIKPRNVRS
jgi:hypothetical protein